MRAIVITRPGDLGSLEVREVATPEARGDRVRVRVRACGLNRADLLQAKGQYPAPPGVPADIPGLEFAGEVDAIGPDATGPLRGRRPGLRDRRRRGFAEFVVCPERMAVADPRATSTSRRRRPSPRRSSPPRTPWSARAGSGPASGS